MSYTFIHFRAEDLYTSLHNNTTHSFAANDIFAADDDMTNTHQLQYDLNTIEAATDKFSDENKLGEGGFGVVYKVWVLYIPY